MQGRKGIPGTTCRSTEGEIMTVEEDNLAIRKEWFRLKEIVEKLKEIDIITLMNFLADFSEDAAKEGYQFNPEIFKIAKQLLVVSAMCKK